MTSGCLPLGYEQNLVGTFPGQYVNERNQVYWAYPCEEMGHFCQKSSADACAGW